MKKNKTMRLISITLLVVMIALVLVSGTYAKYTSSASGSDTVRVAKWSFKVGGANGTDIADPATTTFTFNLFDTIMEADRSAVESDVNAINEDTVIAPGTGGSFDIVLYNASEVSAKYALDYTVTDSANLPVEFSVDNGSTWTNALTDVLADDSNTKLAANGGTTTVTVLWRWAYEGGKYGNPVQTADDAYDTALGRAGTATLTVQVDITATQID